MDARDLLIELYQRIPEHVHEAVDGLGPADLVTEPEPGSNTIGWLIWHLTRVQDSHISEITAEHQVWVSGDWAARCGLTPDPHDTGYGHTRTQMAAVRPDSADLLVSYYQTVAARTDALLQRLTPTELDQVIDDRWDPPVTLGVRLISVADDDIQHAGQATYLRGLLARRAR